MLKLTADQQEHKIRDLTAILADQFALSAEDRKILIPSGTQSLFYNRVGWARTYLVKAGLLETAKRGHIKVAEDGLKLLVENLKQ